MRLERAQSRVLAAAACVWLAWSAASLVYEASTSDASPRRAARYQQTVAASGSQVELAIDSINGQPVTWLNVVQMSTPLQINGWAIDVGAARPARRVLALADGDIVADAPVDGDRPDVAAANANANFAKSGFSLTIPADVLPTGRFTLEVRAVAHGSTASIASPAVIDMVGLP